MSMSTFPYVLGECRALWGRVWTRMRWMCKRMQSSWCGAAGVVQLVWRGWCSAAGAGWMVRPKPRGIWCVSICIKISACTRAYDIISPCASYSYIARWWVPSYMQPAVMTTYWRVFQWEWRGIWRQLGGVAGVWVPTVKCGRELSASFMCLV